MVQEQITPKDFRPDRTQTEFDIPQHSSAGQMVIPDVGCVTLNLPPALEGDGVHKLPPYGPRSAYLVDEWGHAPEGWLKSSVVDGVPHKSYFVPVRAGRGLWLDFNKSKSLHNYHMAALVSIQGVNALTGQKLKGGDVRQEQYIEKCPVHDQPFGADRFCEKCGFKWPKQNYIAGPVQGNTFWIDGFRNADGEVRQFIFTEEEMRSVAKAVLGEDRCWAIGIAFYLSKEPIPRPELSVLRTMSFAPEVMGWSGGGMKSAGIEYTSTLVQPASANLVTYHSGDTLGMMNEEETLECFNSVDSNYVNIASAPMAAAAGVVSEDVMERQMPTKSMAEQGKMYSSGRIAKMQTDRRRVKLEVGAGAKIDQRFHDDPNGLDFWQEKPSGVIVVTYCEEDFCRSILAGPKKDMTNSGENWLKNIPHGNP